MSGSIILEMGGVDVKAADIAEVVRIMSTSGLRLSVRVEFSVIRALVAGDVLKKVRGGKTFTRLFRVASDGGALGWDSRHRAPSESLILMPFIRSIRQVMTHLLHFQPNSYYGIICRIGRNTLSFRESFDQASPSFQKRFDGDGEDTCFSVIMWQGGIVLDLVAQSAQHCEAWVAGLTVS